jgi:hypothetical protein
VPECLHGRGKPLAHDPAGTREMTLPTEAGSFGVSSGIDSQDCGCTLLPGDATSLGVEKIRIDHQMGAVIVSYRIGRRDLPNLPVHHSSYTAKIIQ